MTLSEQEIIFIQGLDPLNNSKYKYNQDKWKGLCDSYRYLVASYANKFVSRQDVIDVYVKSFADSVEFIKPVLLTMIWGHGNDSYGAYRTQKFLSTKGNQEKIEEALILLKGVSKNRFKESFVKLSKVNGLGIRFLSKILYFATKAKNEEKYALIFDRRVAKALVNKIALNSISDIVKIHPSSKFEHYESYIKFMHEIALANKFTAEKLEYYLFKQEF